MKIHYTEEELVNIAIKRIKKKRSLISHIITYVLVNAFLFFIFYVFKVGEMKHLIFIMTCWGLGLLFDISDTIQVLKYKFNPSVLNNEVNKIKDKINK